MTTVEQGGTESVAPRSPAIVLPKVPWTKILAISIFWFALNFHWTALGLIILPNQVLRLVGDAHKGEALALVVAPGAFITIIANPLFGLLSDHTCGWLAAWGRRRPYILLGTLVNVGALIWMAASPTILSLALAYILTQISSNAAQAPFHALLPDIVPSEQRGMVSGVMGLLTTAGSIAGVTVAGILIKTDLSSALYQRNLWLTYGIIMAVILGLMLITIFSVREREGVSAQLAAQQEEAIPAIASEQGWLRRPVWLTKGLLVTVIATIVAVAVLWGLMALWNMFHVAGIELSTDVQGVLLSIVLTIGILRLFDFNPRRDPDFAWVLLTRLLVMLGFYAIQSFLLYYMRDVVRVSDPSGQTQNFVIIVSLTSLVSALVAGWLSDRFGRKVMIYLSGSLMGMVGLIFIVTHALPLVFIAGAIFGLGYGAYISVDWALVADVLPSERHYARDMGVWNISLSVPQVIAPVLGGLLIDGFRANGHPILGFQLLFALAVIWSFFGTIAIRYVKSVR